MLARMPRNYITRPLMVGMNNASATLENSLAVSHKTKHKTHQFHPCTFLPYKMNTYAHKKLVREC